MNIAGPALNLDRPAVAPAPLIDPFARAITYLRVSVTDRCDFRCVYCMSENMSFLPKANLLTLEEFDRRVPEILQKLRPGDLLMLTADHGCDPTWTGTDHTRERVPVFGIGPGIRGGSAGLRKTFADIGETVAEHLGLPPGRHGTSFHSAIA